MSIVPSNFWTCWPLSRISVWILCHWKWAQVSWLNFCFMFSVITHLGLKFYVAVLPWQICIFNCYQFLVNVKFSPCSPWRRWSSGDTDPFIFNLATRWRLVVGFTPRPLYPQIQLHEQWDLLQITVMIWKSAFPSQVYAEHVDGLRDFVWSKNSKYLWKCLLEFLSGN